MMAWAKQNYINPLRCNTPYMDASKKLSQYSRNWMFNREIYYKDKILSFVEEEEKSENKEEVNSGCVSTNFTTCFNGVH